jgi:hypothetical protein
MPIETPFRNIIRHSPKYLVAHGNLYSALQNNPLENQKTENILPLYAAYGSARSEREIEPLKYCGLLPIFSKSGGKSTVRLDISEQVEILSFLKGVLPIFEVLERFREFGQRTGESTGEDPSVPVAEPLVQPGDMFDQPEADSLASHCLQHPRRETVFIAKRLKVGNEQFSGVFDLYEDRHEDLLVVPVPGKEDGCQLV